jgi:transcriptional regulator with XRE-family HTH domain
MLDVEDVNNLDGRDSLTRAERLRGLGGQIRGLRRDQRLSSVELARRCGVSTSLISQVERGLTAPSLEVLWAVARALNVPIGTFFQPDAENAPELIAPAVAAPKAEAVVIRAESRKRLGLTASLTYQLLSPDLQHQIEFVWVEFGPGEQGPMQPFTHVGEEQMVVIRGEMHVWIDGSEYMLREGDAITFDSARPHRSMNRGTVTAVVIAAITPPSF